VELPDRGLRPEQRHDPVARERSEREHVVALVGVELAAIRQAGQAQQRRGDQDRREGERFAPTHDA